VILLVCVGVAFGGCSTPASQDQLSKVSKENLGKQITVEGQAVNRKFGAQLVGADFDLWIDSLSSWPTGYCSGVKKGVKVRATGVLAEDNGLPVFIPKKNVPPVQGILVPPGTDLKQASHRFLLKNAKWKQISE
jgi:hypothetical protein